VERVQILNKVTTRMPKECGAENKIIIKIGKRILIDVASYKSGMWLQDS
jgi:hypothetical protein